MSSPLTCKGSRPMETATLDFPTSPLLEQLHSMHLSYSTDCFLTVKSRSSASNGQRIFPRLTTIPATTFRPISSLGAPSESLTSQVIAGYLPGKCLAWACIYYDMSYDFTTLQSSLRLNRSHTESFDRGVWNLLPPWDAHLRSEYAHWRAMVLCNLSATRPSDCQHRSQLLVVRIYRLSALLKESKCIRLRTVLLSASRSWLKFSMKL